MSGRHTGFKRFIVLTVVSVYLLILAGGIVRTTGSGMGCPDWPKCFGKWVPPTNVSELPSDYKLTYTVHGYDTEFNAVKTWIEYINRLLGALIGIFILAAFVLSFRFKEDKKVILLCGLALLLVLLEGAVGKYVVSTNLKPLLITFHLWGSILVILLLIYVMCRVRKDELFITLGKDISIVKLLNKIIIGTTILQIVLGTQVRQQIDELSKTLGFGRRPEWISSLDYYFEIHRSFSILVFLINVYFIYRLYKLSDHIIIKWFVIGLVGFIGVEILGGIIMAYFNIPAFIQPIHMLVAIMLLGLQFLVLFVLNLNSKNKVDVQ